ncbi:hypothetical protein ACFO1B_40600 [Dactylosporangium siamense]|uniref:hypothetical protein n=1 Tax=Dactylosporangium siamense TaxID=685454 RepID=UPI001944FE17|nr:hypothetical protein [Dactylosporangium siamense]
MGSRANVAVRQDGVWTHRGGGGLGYSLDTLLALGPDPALAAFLSPTFPVWQEHQWYRESSCESGALIDVDAKELLVFLNVDYDERCAYLDAYRRTWPGWNVRWAYNGIVDVTDALGLDRAVLTREAWDDTDLFRWGRPDPQEPPKLHYLITIEDAAYGLADNVVRPWALGPAVLEQLVDLPRLSTWPEIPRGGMHVDPADHTVGVWSIDPVYGLVERCGERWPGWTVEFWHDRYAEQQRRCAGTFRFPDPGPAVDLCGYAMAKRVVEHWICTTPQFLPHIPMRTSYDGTYGMRYAGLTVADLQRLGELILGPDRDPNTELTVPDDWPPQWTAWLKANDWCRPLDVAAYAREQLPFYL